MLGACKLTFEQWVLQSSEYCTKEIAPPPPTIRCLPDNHRALVRGVRHQFWHSGKHKI